MSAQIPTDLTGRLKRNHLVRTLRQAGQDRSGSFALALPSIFRFGSPGRPLRQTAATGELRFSPVTFYIGDILVIQEASLVLAPSCGR